MCGEVLSNNKRPVSLYRNVMWRKLGLLYFIPQENLASTYFIAGINCCVEVVIAFLWIEEGLT